MWVNLLIYQQLKQKIFSWTQTGREITYHIWHYTGVPHKRRPLTKCWPSFPTYKSFPCNLPTNLHEYFVTALIWFVHRHQDQHNQVFSMVAASTRWLAVRADLLCSVLISAVAFTSVLLTQHPGKEIKFLILSFPLPVAFWCFIFVLFQYTHSKKTR